jgi:hypothetical protein
VRRNWFVGAIVIGVLAIVVAALVMRLSEDDPETTADWADAVCTSLSDWRTSIASLAEAGDEPLTADTLRDRLDEGGQATSALVTELRDLGPPDLETGDDVEQALDDAAAGLQTSFEDVQSAGDDATEAESPSELGSALAELSQDVAALISEVGDVVATLRSASLFGDASAELEQAFAEADSCQALQTDS